MSEKLTREQAKIIGAYTGILCGPFEDLHGYIEDLLGRSVWTHELGNAQIMETIKIRAKPDFQSILPDPQEDQE